MTSRRAVFVFALVLGCAGSLGAESIRVATINVANYLVTDRMVEGVYRREYPKPESQKAALRGLLRAVDADVVALQEVGTENFLRELQRDLEREGLRYPHRAWMKGSDRERHLAVLSRLPFQKVIPHDRILFDYLGESTPVKRGLLEIVFEDKGKTWRLFNLHLKSRYMNRADDPRSEQRRVGEARAVRDLVRERLAAEPGALVLLAGDFNDSPASRALERFLEIDDEPFLAAVPAADSRGETWTYFYQRHDVYSRVDYFLASPTMMNAIRSRRAWIVDVPEFAAASDHRLLWLELNPSEN